jgi:hypothetical protein
MTTDDIIKELTARHSDWLRDMNQWNWHVESLKALVRTPEFRNSKEEAIQQQLNSLSRHWKDELGEFIKLQKQARNPLGAGQVEVEQILAIHDLLEGLYAIIDTNAAP